MPTTSAPGGAIGSSGLTAPPGPFDAFARYYDADYRNYAEDVDLILTLATESAGKGARESGGPILELGCGTGRLLLPLAQQGHTVTGLDVSPALLAVARRKLQGSPFAAAVELVEADMRRYSLARKNYAFAFCTSNTLMHLADPGDQMAALRNTHRHLRRGGALLLDLFNPDVLRLAAVDGLQELADQWQDDDSGAQVIKWAVRSVDWAEQIQETIFIYEETLPDGGSRRTICPFTLRFLWRHEAELMLQAAGFTVEAVWGDFEGGAYDAASDHLILLARKE
jgi:SAM-dependent methyltransferase